MTHTGEKAHKCYQCLPCVHAPSFKIQMRTHIGEMSYKCSQCNYTCTRVTNLHTHMLTHTEVIAFNCDQCVKIFSRKSYVIKHSLSQAQMYEHKEPRFLTMRSPWFDYEQRARAGATHRSRAVGAPARWAGVDFPTGINPARCSARTWLTQVH